MRANADLILANAVTFLNRVRTKTPTQDVYGVGASLPACAGPQTTNGILLDIYKNRQVELAFQGFRLEDNRRFGRSATGTPGAERNRNSPPTPAPNATTTPVPPPLTRHDVRW